MATQTQTQTPTAGPYSSSSTSSSSPSSCLTARPRRRVQFEIDEAGPGDDSIRWADLFLPSETKSPWPEVATSLSCSVALLCLFGGPDNLNLPLGIVLAIFALHALLLLLLTGMRTCTRKFGPGMSGLRQLLRSTSLH